MSTTAFDIAFYKTIANYFQAIMVAELVGITYWEYKPTRGGPWGTIEFTTYTKVPYHIRLDLRIDVDDIPSVDVLVETIKETYMDIKDADEADGKLRAYRYEEIDARD